MLSTRAELPTATDLINVQFIRRISTICVEFNKTPRNWQKSQLILPTT